MHAQLFFFATLAVISAFYVFGLSDSVTCCSQRALLKDLPVIPSRQPQRLTDFERRQIVLSGQEASHDYLIRARTATVGLVDIRIVAGELEDKAMTTAQSRLAPTDVCEKVGVDMRQRKRAYHDSNVVHIWTQSNCEGMCLFQEFCCSMLSSH